MIRRPPRSTQSRSSAASDVYKRQECPVRCSDTPSGIYGAEEATAMRLAPRPVDPAEQGRARRTARSLAAAGASLAGWPVRRWSAAALTAVATYLVIAIPTDLIDTPFFSREVAPTAWSW